MKLLLLLISLSLVDSTDILKTEAAKESAEYPEKMWHKKYKPDWKDLMTRPLPTWFDRSKIGILIHWGVYSVPAFASEWFWRMWIDHTVNIREWHNIKKFMENNYYKTLPSITYQDFAPMFKAEKFDADRLAALFKDVGARYVILSAKHHDGYTLFPSERTRNWNSFDVGPIRDLLGEFSLAVKKLNIIFGIQYSLSEWHNPEYLADKESEFKNHTYRDKILQELKSVVNRYAPTIIRVHGDQEASSHYWKSQEFVAWLYNESPVRRDIVVNDKWGRGVRCMVGGYISCPKTGGAPTRKWENMFSLDKYSFGYRSGMQWGDVVQVQQIINTILSTVSSGGNVLINIGLTKEGELPNMFEYTLRDVGEWLKINAEAIYDTSPWFYQYDAMDENIRYTCKKREYNPLHPASAPRVNDNVTTIYAMFTKWPVTYKLKLAAMIPYFRSGSYNIEIVGKPGIKLQWSWHRDKAVVIHLPQAMGIYWNYAWTLKFDIVKKNTKLEDEIEAEKEKRKWSGPRAIQEYLLY